MLCKITLMLLATTHIIISCQSETNAIEEEEAQSKESEIFYIQPADVEARRPHKNISAIVEEGEIVRKKHKSKHKKRKNSAALNAAIQKAALDGLEAMIELYERKEPEIVRKGQGN
jgi:hypothetical protein